MHSDIMWPTHYRSGSPGHVLNIWPTVPVYMYVLCTEKKKSDFVTRYQYSLIKDHHSKLPRQA